MTERAERSGIAPGDRSGEDDTPRVHDDTRAVAGDEQVRRERPEVSAAGSGCLRPLDRFLELTE
jgi:hypothetical protein